MQNDTLHLSRALTYLIGPYPQYNGKNWRTEVKDEHSEHWWDSNTVAEQEGRFRCMSQMTHARNFLILTYMTTTWIPFTDRRIVGGTALNDVAFRFLPLI
jgi:hypothetical protein